MPRNRVDLKMTFDEGDAAQIKQINIVGNEVYDDEELFSKMELKFDKPWWNFFSQTRYQQQVLSGDLETITSYYKDRGYLQFNIDSTQVSMSPEKDGIYVTLNVSEGDTYMISGVDLVGDLLGFESFLSSVVPLNEGDLYNQAQVTATEDFIARYLGRFGYAYPTVTTIPQVNEEDNTVNLTLSVDPGKRIYVRRIGYSGNLVTADKVLRQNTVQLEGTWLSDPLLQTSRSQLSRLTYMDSVEYETIRIPGEEDKVDVEFKVREQAAGSFNAGIGFGDATGLSLNAGIQQDNFLGSGKRIGLNLSTVTFQRTAQINYLDPYFTVDGISLGGNLAYSEFDGSDFGIIQFNSKRLSVGTTIGYPINEVNRISFGLTYSDVELSSDQNNLEQTRLFFEQFQDPNDPEAPVDYDSFQVNVNWTRNTLNRGLFPTSGSSQRLSFSATTPNSEVNFFKIVADTRWYFPLSRNQRWSFLARMRLGYGNGYGEENGIEQVLPFNENFTAGGADTLRGFENNTVGPRGVTRIRQPSTFTPGGTPILADPSLDTITVTSRSLGGNALAVGSLELIVPTPFLSAELDNSVRTSLFVKIPFIEWYNR